MQHPSKIRTLLYIISAATVLAACDMSVLKGQRILHQDDNTRGHVYYLPHAVAKITVSRSKSGTTEVEALKLDELRFEPDRNYKFSLTHIKNILFDDHLIVNTDENGLLKEVSAETTDKTRDIVKSILSIVEGLAKLTSVGSVWEEDRPASKAPLFKVTAYIDPYEPQSIKDVNDHLHELKEKKLRIQVRPLFKKNLTSSNHDVSSNAEQSHYRQPDCLREVCYRPVVPYVIELIDWEKHLAGDRNRHGVIHSELIVVPDQELIASVRVTRAAFVKKITKLTFSKGVLIGTDVNNPSQLLGFMNIPVDIVRMLVSLPSAILDFKVTQKQNDTKLLTAQTNQIKAQNSLIDAQQKLLEKQAQANTLGCVPGDPNC